MPQQSQTLGKRRARPSNQAVVQPQAVVAPPVAHAPRGSRCGAGPVLDWERKYRTSVIVSDVVTVTAVLAVCALIALFDSASSLSAPFAIPIGVILLGSLAARKAWQTDVLGHGAEEYRRLGLGLFTGAVVIALIAPFITTADARPWVFAAIPAIAAIAFVARYALRKTLHRSRRFGQCMLPVVAAGGEESIRELIDRARENVHVGWLIQAVCVTTPETSRHTGGEIDGVPIVGRLDALAELVRRSGYRVVAVTSDQYWTPDRVRQLAWDLEGTSAELVVAPVLMEMGGPRRLDLCGVLGMPMLRVTQPTFTGWRRLVKELVDRAGAALLLTLVAPALLVIALAIKMTSKGPVSYRQDRVKRDGEIFRIWKFRTMRVGAAAELADLVAANESDGPLFKIRHDPRVTVVGRTLRRYSADELPQLFNVLCGHMSLVGPRPPLPEESRTYDPDVGRRLLVKPGMTGLWQVSGRSDLTWQESVRLDLQYVDDWSLALDAVILWKTLRAVISGKGAY